MNLYEAIDEAVELLEQIKIKEYFFNREEAKKKINITKLGLIEQNIKLLKTIKNNYEVKK